MRIVLLGGPGAGKGTQAQKLSEKFSLPHIATGDILRQAVKDGTEMGIKAKSYMDKGLLVPDEVVIGIIKDRFNQDDVKSGFVLDGFPRTVPQAESLDSITKEMNMPIDAVVNIKTSPDVVVERLSGRRTCKECQTVYHIVYSPPKVDGKCDRCGGELYQRDDDKEETIRKRLDVYEKQTFPLLEYYKNSGKLLEVCGDVSIDEVFESIVQALKK
ncbi:TPA: adenylate kinase [Candidatus Poribacteria bacterium]|nr:adenylate kinase [Candidatus Poribacteria bacterium]